MKSNSTDRLICRHCSHSGDGLPVRIHCAECFISKQWFNALWSTTSCAPHTSSGEPLDSTRGGWDAGGWCLRTKSLSAARIVLTEGILIENPCLCKELREVQDS